MFLDDYTHLKLMQMIFSHEKLQNYIWLQIKLNKAYFYYCILLHFNQSKTLAKRIKRIKQKNNLWNRKNIITTAKNNLKNLEMIMISITRHILII